MKDKKKYLILLAISFVGLIIFLDMDEKYDYGIKVTSADGYMCDISWRVTWPDTVAWFILNIFQY